MNETLQKELDKNYSKVQKKELKVAEESDKLLAKAEKANKSLESKMKDEFKEHKALDKKIKDEYKASLKEMKEEATKKLSELKSKDKDFNEKHAEELKKADDKNLKEVTKLNGLIEKANNAFSKEEAKVLKEYDKDVENSNKEIEKIEAENIKDTEKHQAKFDEVKEKYDNKVITLNTKRDEKVTKLSDASEKKIAKLQKDIETQRAKVDKQIADLVPIFDEKVGEVDELINNEKAESDEKINNIKATLESKVARRNKFLEKAENENDTKAAKQQRKEIKQLELNADRELKIVYKAHGDRNSDLLAKKREANKNNLEQLSGIERDFTNTKEDYLMQIELNKATLADNITKTKLDTELKLQDELSKFNEFEEKHINVVAEDVKKFELLIQEQNDYQVKALVEFDKTNEVNALELAEELAKLDKELRIAEFTKVNEYELSKLALEVELAKLEAQTNIAAKKLELDLLLNEEDALIKEHKSDFNKQSSVKNQFLGSQETLNVVYQGRAKEVLEYEELEVESRTALKVKFLEAQQARVEKDFKNLSVVIENSFKNEKELFDKEINKIAKEDQKELAAYTKTAEAAIAELVEEKKESVTLDDSKRIKDIEFEIETLRNDLQKETASKTEQIKGKTVVFQDYLAQAVARKELAIREAQEMLDFETKDISYAVELLNQNKEAELQEIKARYAKTLQNANNYSNVAANRNASTTEENTNYLNARVASENNLIESSKAKFEENKNEINSDLDSKLSQFESDKNVSIEKVKNDSLNAEKDLEAKVAELNHKVAESGNKATTRLSDQMKVNASKITEFGTKRSNIATESANDLKLKETRYKLAVAQIDKKADVEKKNYEASQARVQKEYEIELKKGIININSKLEADIKAL